mgnify:CR=1 FL=1
MNLKVLNPVAKRQVARQSVAPANRLARFDGQVIGLYWNYKHGGDVALERVAEILKSRYAGVETRNYVGSVGANIRMLTKDDVGRIASECNAVVSSTAD